jgi:hypothetical protein
MNEVLIQTIQLVEDDICLKDDLVRTVQKICTNTQTEKETQTQPIKDQSCCQKDSCGFCIC